MTINIASLKEAQLIQSPYPHAIIKNFITKEFADTLIKISPKSGNLYSKRDKGSDKTYQVQNNILYDLNLGIASLKSPWDKFIVSLDSDEYRAAISELLGKDIMHAPLEITFKKYGYNDYISPHTDRDLVYCTHLLFFNLIWEKNWGGNLQMLDESNNVLKEVLPLANYSFFFERTENSWHAVSACTQKDQSRYSLQIAFWKRKNKISLPGRLETVIS